MDIRVAGIIKESVVDGPGFRYVIFSQGCTHRCKGCHNPDTHDIKGGRLVHTDTLINEIQQSKHIDGVTFSGGEPFLQAKAFAHIAERLKKRGIHIMCYTGFTFEQLLSSNDADQRQLLMQLDVLIDGPYIEAQKDLSLSYRGSRNQRLINVQTSLALNGVVLEESFKEVC